MAVETSGKDWRIAGNATFTIDRSRATMNAAATVTANTGHGIVGRSSCFTTRGSASDLVVVAVIVGSSLLDYDRTIMI